ncbi:MAG TPA: hypothetical protein VK988_07515 [Acidimicrobiales bacterium]|nr:hypothetical protein [Acidimicrobiales bacterium]
MIFGSFGIALCVALILYALVAIPEISTDKKLSETLLTLLAAGWCAGFVVAGRILRRP